jgi:hypothetical protein
MLEAAGKAVETYDELAERGKTVVERYRGTGDGAATEVTVVVEQVVVHEPEAPAAKPEPKPEVEDATVKEERPEAAATAKPQAKKTASTPRKRAAAPKTTASNGSASNGTASKSTASKSAKA